MADTEQPNVMSLTVTLLSAYFANNTVPSAELPALIEGTRKALLGDPLAAPTASAEIIPAPAAAPVPEPSPTPAAAAAPAEPIFVPAVTVEDSLASPDVIRSMIDGKPYKALKRHLSTNGLTPAEYRVRYNLPKDYPMVAPSYSEARRAVAKRLGLGNRQPVASDAGLAPSVSDAPAPEVAAPEVTASAAPTKPKPTPKKAKKATAPTVAAKAARKPRAAKVAAVEVTPDAAALPKPKRTRAKASAPAPAPEETAAN